MPPVANEPFQPAWDDLISLSHAGKNYRVQIAALRTSLQGVVRGQDNGDSSKFSFISFPAYEPWNPQPSLMNDDFELRSQCLMHLDEEGADATDANETDMTDSICLFLYEVRTCVAGMKMDDN